MDGELAHLGLGEFKRAASDGDRLQDCLAILGEDSKFLSIHL
jgi:hypothetical protein